MRIIGIDPGIARLGWAIIEKASPSKITPITYDCFETSKNEQKPQRLHQIFTFLSDTLTKYRPDTLAIEELFFNTNAKTALIVGEARGIILLCAARQNIPIAIYTPLQVKIAVAGYGRADKPQVSQMVKTLLKLPTIPTPDDTADALAIALTHAYSVR